MPRFLSPIYVKQEIVTGNEIISGNETILGVTSGKESYWLTVNSELSVSSDLGYFDTLSSNYINSINLETYSISSTNLSSSFIDSLIINALTGYYQTLTASNVTSNYFIGDGSKLTGILASGGYSTDIFKLPLTGGTLTGGLTGTEAYFNLLSSAIISGTYYGDGSKLTGILAYGGTATDSTKLPLSGGILTGGLTGTEAYFNLLSSSVISGTYYGDGSKLTGVIAAGGVATDNTKLPLSGGILNGDLILFGGLTALSGSTFVNTIFTTTSALSIVNSGLGPALYVLQGEGSGDIASFYDGDGIEVLHIGNALNPISNGVVGIKTSYPNKTLTVIGEVSATSAVWSSTYYGDGSKLTGIIAAGGVATDNTKLPLSGGTLTGGLTGTTSVFTTSISSPSISGVFYGDASKLLNLPSTGLSSTVVADLSVGSISAGQTILSGTSFQQFVEKLLTATFYPTFTAPTATLTSNLASSVESGTTGITLTVNLNRGAITGKTVAGIWQPSTFQDYRSGAATNYVILGVNNSTSNVYTSAAAVIGDGSNIFSSTVTYADGPQPVDSKGNNYSTFLTGGSLSPTVTVSGRRKAFYGINNTVDSSASIRSLAGSTLNPINGTSFSISIPIGATSVVFAYPSTLQDVTSVKESVLNAEIKSAFTQTTVAVEGLSSYTAINYKVYRYVPVEAYASAVTYTITI